MVRVHGQCSTALPNVGCLLGIAWAGFGVSQFCGFTLYLGLALPFPTAVGVSRWVVLENMVSEFVGLSERF